MRPPDVYSAINAITADLAREGMPKLNFNLQDDYFYRSIDDVINRLAPLLATHRLCVLPRALERQSTDRSTPSNGLMCHVVLKVAYDFISVEDGSRHTIEAFSEALDEGDKATAKATSGAYKSAMLQAFCIPVVGEYDVDRGVVGEGKKHGSTPPQGWEQWSSDIIEIIGSCESVSALDRVQQSNRDLLKAIQRERADLYHSIGNASIGRRAVVSAPRLDIGSIDPAPKPSPVVKSSDGKRKSRAPRHA
jgi:hypothetical protein